MLTNTRSIMKQKRHLAGSGLCLLIYSVRDSITLLSTLLGEKNVVHANVTERHFGCDELSKVTHSGFEQFEISLRVPRKRLIADTALGHLVLHLTQFGKSEVVFGSVSKGKIGTSKHIL